MPSPTCNTTEDTWYATSQVGQVMLRAPEEVYVEFGTTQYPYSPTQGTAALSGNFYWAYPPSQSGSQRYESRQVCKFVRSSLAGGEGAPPARLAQLAASISICTSFGLSRSARDSTLK
jgi:hypothetical protein